MNYSKDELIAKLGIGALDDDIQEQLLGTFLQTLDDRTSRAISGKLSDKQLEEFNTVVSEKGDEAAEAWLREHVADFDNLEQQEFNAMIAELDETSAAK